MNKGAFGRDQAISTLRERNPSDQTIMKCHSSFKANVIVGGRAQWRSKSRRVYLHFWVALPEDVPEALPQEQALEGFPLLWCEASRPQVPTGVGLQIKTGGSVMSAHHTS